MEIFFSAGRGVPAVAYKGEYDFDRIIESCVSLKKEKEPGKTKGVIMDFSLLDGGLSVFESFAFAKKLREACRSSEKIAFVREGGLLEGEGVCAEIIYNMGFNIEVFRERENAEEWVKGE